MLSLGDHTSSLKKRCIKIIHPWLSWNLNALWNTRILMLYQRGNFFLFFSSFFLFKPFSTPGKWELVQCALIFLCAREKVLYIYTHGAPPFFSSCRIITHPIYLLSNCAFQITKANNFPDVYFHAILTEVAVALLLPFLFFLSFFFLLDIVTLGHSFKENNSRRTSQYQSSNNKATVSFRI